VYKANDKYWNPDAVKVARIELNVISDEQTAINAFKAGDIDMVTLSMLSSAQVGDLAKADKTVKVDRYDGQASLIVAMSPKANPILQDPSVRRALSLGLDRQAISDQLLNSTCTPTTQVFAPGVPGYVKSLDEKKIYDAKEAKKLLAKAGQPNPEINMIAPNVEPYQTVVTVLQAQLAAIGVKLNVQIVPASQSVGLFTQGAAPMFMSLAIMAPSAVAFANYNNVRSVAQVPQDLVDLVNEAAPLPQDGSQARKLYEQVNTSLATTPVAIPICRVSYFVLHRSTVTGADQLPFTKPSNGFDASPMGVLKAGKK
jgi:peptide/nickel transport system substrate-binding protein